MQGHTIVCGDDALALRIVEELTTAGMRVVKLQDPEDLAAAGITEATAGGLRRRRRCAEP